MILSWWWLYIERSSFTLPSNSLRDLWNVLTRYTHWYQWVYLINIPEPVQYHIYAMAFRFDLRCESITWVLSSYLFVRHLQHDSLVTLIELEIFGLLFSYKHQDTHPCILSLQACILHKPQYNYLRWKYCSTPAGELWFALIMYLNVSPSASDAYTYNKFQSIQYS